MASRRTVLSLLAGGGVAYAGFRFAPLAFEGDLEFTDLDDPAGFRSFGCGDYSAGSFDPFIGLGSDEERQLAQLVTEDEVRADICSSLYGQLGPPDNRIRIAAFSDYYCPFCRIQTRNLAALAEQYSDRLAVAWHEMPLLGDASEAAARAALAARRQGRYVEFQEQLIRTPFVANDAYIETLCANIGVDHAMLVEDMASNALTREMQTSKILYQMFRFVGTLAMVIGRTALMGQISDRQILSIVSTEEDGSSEGAC
jgi:predicted DsbA family dithiol-disulfide isomerase